MGIFLTGPRQVGKSTALYRGLRLSGLRYGGVMTRFGGEASGERRLYLLPYAPERELSSLPPEAVCACMGPEGRRAFPQVFDAVGAALLRRAVADPAVDVVVLDELGFLEAEAMEFRSAVLAALRGEKPVLGVVRQGLGAWGDVALGEVWSVTVENRGEMGERLAAALRG